MNIILVKPDELIADSVVLSDYRARHIVKVLRSTVGDCLRVGVVDGEMGVATVRAVTSKYPFEVRLSVQLGKESLPVPDVDLLLALPRPIMLKRILSQVTALGVGTIYLLNAARVEKSFWEASVLGEEEYRLHLLQGLEQAVDTRLPEVKLYRGFRPFVEDVLPELAPGYTNMLLAHPETDGRLADGLTTKTGRTLYAVGPEGGWVDFEVERLGRAGFRSFSMGKRILKVDTAVVAIHSRINQLLDP